MLDRKLGFDALFAFLAFHGSKFFAIGQYQVHVLVICEHVANKITAVFQCNL